MITQEKFTEMFKLQNTLNNQTNGTDWKKGRTNKGREIDWKRCVYMEGAELLDSFPNWKHWKDINKPDDIANAKIETCDIWHFLMSDAIQSFIESNENYSIEQVSEVVFKLHQKELNNTSWKEKTLIQLSEAIIKSSINGEIAMREFFQIVNAIDGFDMEEVYKLYIGKNCLNHFRQDNGYIDGSYIKEWNGEEDNVHMQKFLNENPDTSFDELYVFLTTTYNTLAKDKG